MTVDRLEPGWVDENRALLADNTPAALTFAGVTCRFPDRSGGKNAYTAVSNVDLHVRPGEFVSVVGPTGCGKSTLLNVAAGLLAPSAGYVEVFGKKLTTVNSQAGYLFQADALFPG